MQTQHQNNQTNNTNTASYIVNQRDESMPFIQNRPTNINELRQQN